MTRPTAQKLALSEAPRRRGIVGLGARRVEANGGMGDGEEPVEACQSLLAEGFGKLGGAHEAALKELVS